jgi:hypothetical protein
MAYTTFPVPRDLAFASPTLQAAWHPPRGGGLDDVEQGEVRQSATCLCARSTLATTHRARLDWGFDECCSRHSDLKPPHGGHGDEGQSRKAASTSIARERAARFLHTANVALSPWIRHLQEFSYKAPRGASRREAEKLGAAISFVT